MNYAGYNVVDKEIIRKIDEAVKESLTFIGSSWSASCNNLFFSYISS